MFFLQIEKKNDHILFTQNKHNLGEQKRATQSDLPISWGSRNSFSGGGVRDTETYHAHAHSHKKTHWLKHNKAKHFLQLHKYKYINNCAKIIS